jgi:hypothetical protein
VAQCSTEWDDLQLPKRFERHRADTLTGCQIIMIVDVGSQSSRGREDAMKMYFPGPPHPGRRPQGHNVEVFRGPDHVDEAEYFARAGSTWCELSGHSPVHHV